MRGPVGDGSEPWHGTSGGYTNHRCRCDDCRAAKNVAQQRSKARRKARLAADPSIRPHGSSYTYIEWGCRCGPCTEAHRINRAQYRRS